MSFISTTDNNLGKTLGELDCTSENTSNVYADLSTIANTPIKELCEKNPALLVFPHALGNHGDEIGTLKICELSGSLEQPQNAKLTTNNLMGFIGYGNTQVTIKSRFSKGNENDFFLHYMLEKVFSINLFDFKHTSSNGGLDLLIFLFPAMLRKAIVQGVFKTYRNFKHNDVNVKGAIDIPRHIQKNIPFAGRVAYNSRERTFDNAVTQLIRHTIEFIKTKPHGKRLITSNPDTKTDVEKIIQATQSYNYFDHNKTLAQNAKPINHAFFTAYRPLQKLCLAILHHQKIAYYKNSHQIYGVLFDGAWLWEEYLAKVLQPCGFVHPKNKSGVGGIRMFAKDVDETTFDKNHRRIYPDFYKPNDRDGKNGVILDAKYKRLQNGVGRDDLYQIVTYMHTMKIDAGGFIYPIAKGEIQSSDPLQHQRCQLAGYGGEVGVIGLVIPCVDKAKSVVQQYEGFCEGMRVEEEKLRKVVRDIEVMLE